MNAENAALDGAQSEIRRKIRTMGEEIRVTLHDVFAILNQLDFRRAETIVKDDVNYNRINQSIQEDCLNLIARKEPAFSVLREIIADLQIAVELERIADHAADIARVIPALKDRNLPPVLDIIETMFDHCDEMLSKMLGAYRQNDPGQAEAIAAHDDEIDHMNGLAVTAIIDFMQKHREAVENGTHLIWLVHHLERIGDRIANIGEHILFATSGKIVDWNRS